MSVETLSVVVITRNEEANIGPCLAGADFADEIVVLDSGSTDRTMEIARTFTDRVFSRQWDGYAGQRNAAHDLATADWILSLDADERITPDLAAEIRRVLAAPPPDVEGYELPYKVYYRGRWLKHGGFFPERHLRLFRRGRGRYGERAVHEALRVDGRVERLNGFVEHHSYVSVADFITRMQTYSDLSAEEYRLQGRGTGPLRMTGHALFTVFRMYVLQLGFLDGYPGFLMAGLYGIYTFVKYAKLYERMRKET